MADLNIASLKLNVADAHGHEHRLGPIASSAAGLFAMQVQERWPGGLPAHLSVVAPALSDPLAIDFNLTPDREAAQYIADAWFRALTARLED